MVMSAGFSAANSVSRRDLFALWNAETSLSVSSRSLVRAFENCSTDSGDSPTAAVNVVIFGRKTSLMYLSNTKASLAGITSLGDTKDMQTYS